MTSQPQNPNPYSPSGAGSNDYQGSSYGSQQPQQPYGSQPQYGSQNSGGAYSQQSYGQSAGYGAQQSTGFQSGEQRPHPAQELGDYAYGEGSENFWHATEDEKTMGWVSHLLGWLTNFIGPLVIYIMKKNESAFIRHHAAQSLNLQITLGIASLAIGILTLITFGIASFLFPIIGIVSLVFELLALLAATKGQGYRIALAIPFVK